MGNKIHLPETLSFVLWVNDKDTMDQERLEWLLRRNTAVIKANSTESAIHMFKRVYQFDAVVTDLRRYEGPYENPQAGIELAAAIRRLGEKVPIILYSINIDAPTRHKALAAGINHVTVMPTELLDYLQQYL